MCSTHFENSRCENSHMTSKFVSHFAFAGSMNRAFQVEKPSYDEEHTDPSASWKQRLVPTTGGKRWQVVCTIITFPQLWKWYQIFMVRPSCLSPTPINVDGSHDVIDHHLECLYVGTAHGSQPMIFLSRVHVSSKMVANAGSLFNTKLEGQIVWLIVVQWIFASITVIGFTRDITNKTRAQFYKAVQKKILFDKFLCYKQTLSGHQPQQCNLNATLASILLLLSNTFLSLVKFCNTGFIKLGTGYEMHLPGRCDKETVYSEEAYSYRYNN